METINLTVSGMTCGACVKHVEKAISAVPGVEGVAVELTSGAVKIQSRIAPNVAQIIEALGEEGYLATVSPDAVGKEGRVSCRSGSSCCCH